MSSIEDKTENFHTKKYSYFLFKRRQKLLLKNEKKTCSTSLICVGKKLYKMILVDVR